MCLLVCWWIQQRSPNWPQRCNTKVPSTRGKPSKRMFPRSLDQSESSFIAAQIIFKGRNLNIMCEDSNCSFHPLLLWSSHHKHHAHYMYFIWWHKCIQLSEIECVWYPTCQVLFQSPWALLWLAMAGVQPHYNLLVNQRKPAFSCMCMDTESWADSPVVGSNLPAPAWQWQSLSSLPSLARLHNKVWLINQYLNFERFLILNYTSIS